MVRQSQLIDPHGRTISYVRLSVTDRCDFRCIYCMDEKMTFLPRREVLTLEEIATLATAFSELGVSKIRLTGGEPLIRKGIATLFKTLGELPEVEDLTLTTNGSNLASFVPTLLNAKVRRVNVSLDSLDAAAFKAITRTGNLDEVLKGIFAARQAGLNVKINAVILREKNLHQARALCHFAIDNGLDISFIEEMPLGEVSSHQRNIEYISSASLRDHLSQYFQFFESTKKTGGPSRYWRLNNTSSHAGFISPHSDNFCESCNRVRVTAQGRMLLCLGNEHSVDLKKVLRNSSQPLADVKQAIVDGLTIKPLKHHFNLDEKPQIIRFMNATGG